jgi:ferritin-like metal-binding protein YciE
LNDLFIHELSDIYSAEKQMTKSLPKMARGYKSGFGQHFHLAFGRSPRAGRTHRPIVELSDFRLKRINCAAMEGLVEKGKDVIGEIDKGPVLDAALIAACQKAEHYEIASYGTLCRLAKLLGHTKAYKLLQSTLAEEKATDEKLNTLALAEADLAPEKMRKTRAA